MSALAIRPLAAPPDATVSLPGSKSLTNRMLLVAGMARGTSTLEGVLWADDTEAMIDCLGALDVSLQLDPGSSTVVVTGSAGHLPLGEVLLDARSSATTARFLAPVLATGPGRYVMDGSTQLRARPIGPLVEALRALGATVEAQGAADHLPFAVRGVAGGGRVSISGDVSSQFLSGLMLAGPLMADGLEVTLTTPLVSRPYASMTAGVLRSFGAAVEVEDRVVRVQPGGYEATSCTVEPDASAASYFWAAAAITGGRVVVPGLSRRSAQGDVGFVDVLDSMGAEVTWLEDAVEVRGTGTLHGVEVDLADLSDTVPTLAVTAAFASSPTRVTGVGFIRSKESDRIGAVVRELHRCGIQAEEEPDGFVIHPGVPRSAVVQTYDDHRMAMAFALIGLVVPGIEIADPGCVSKTFPDYFESLEQLRGG